MKKTLLGLIAVLLLGVGAYFSLQKQETTSTIAGDDSAFTVEDTAAVTRFFIASKDGRNYHFVKQSDGEWLVNDKWQAERGMVQMVLGTMFEMRVKAPVPKGHRNGVIRTLAGNGIKVEVYTKEGKLKTFYVGDETADDLGTHMIMEGSEQPYIVHIPRFNGYLTTRFKVDKMDFMDKAIFEYGPDDIKSVSVVYPLAPDSGFSVSPDLLTDENTDSVKVKTYFHVFKKVHAEQHAIVKDMERLKDSLSTATPVAVVKVEAIEPKPSREIVLYNANDPDRMLGYLPQQNRFVWVQMYIFRNILVGQNHFEKRQTVL